jgi:hypothetical protein
MYIFKYVGHLASKCVFKHSNCASTMIREYFFLLGKTCTTASGKEVFMCIYTYMYIYTYVNMYIYRIYVYIYLYKYLYYMHKNTYSYINIYVYTHILQILEGTPLQSLLNNIGSKRCLDYLSRWVAYVCIYMHMCMLNHIRRNICILCIHIFVCDIHIYVHAFIS